MGVFYTSGGVDGNAGVALKSEGQGCIKLGLVHAGAGLREVFPLVSADTSNPAGLVAGSRGSFRGSG
jgi:hypothetical protein